MDAATEDGVFELEVVASVIEVSALEELGGR